MPEPQITVRSTEAGRVTEVVVPGGYHTTGEMMQVEAIIHSQIPRAGVFYHTAHGYIAIRQPNGPDVVALAGDTLRIAAGRVERVREDERHDDS